MAHTPGPWHQSRSGDDGENWTGWRVAAAPDHAAMKTWGATICTVEDVDYGPETAKANTRLIIASPDLLDALRGLLNVRIPHDHGNLWPTQIAENAEVWQEAWAKARAAVAKAEGW